MEFHYYYIIQDIVGVLMGDKNVYIKYKNDFIE